MTPDVHESLLGIRGLLNQSVIAVDVPCVACEYSLRMQPTQGLCPECGTPVGESLNGSRPLFGGSAWLGRIWWGLLIAPSAITWGLAVAALGTAVGSLVANEQRPAVMLIVAAIGFCPGVLAAVATVLLVTARRDGWDGEARWAIVARVAIAAWVASMIAFCLLVRLAEAGPFPELWGFVAWAELTIFSVGVSAFTLAVMGTARRLSALATSARARGLAFSCKCIFWLGVVFQVLGWIVYLCATFFVHRGLADDAPLADSAVFLIAGGGLIGLLVVFCMSCVAALMILFEGVPCISRQMKFAKSVEASVGQ